MTDVKKPRVARFNPLPGSFAAQLRALTDRLNFDEPRAAKYLGVPVFTLRKWATGERQPGAAVARLLEVLGFLEAMAPALHEALVPAKSVADSDKARATRKRKPAPAPGFVANSDKARATTSRPGHTHTPVSVE